MRCLQTSDQWRGVSEKQATPLFMEGKRMEKKRKKSWKKGYGWGYLMISPLVLGLGVFYFYPVFKVFFDSFHEVGAFNQTKWIGLANYEKMFQDPVMWQALGNTVKYVLIIVPSTIILALILATFLNMGIKGRSFFRVVYFIPAITMGAAVAMIWRWMYNGDYGIINFILNKLGMESVQFLSNPSTALVSISIVTVSYTHLTLPTKVWRCRSRWSPYH